MANVQALTDLANIDEPEEFMRFASILLSAIVDTVNGNLEFSNMLAERVTVSFPAANTNVVVNHGLKKTGVLWITASLSDAMIVYRGTSADDTNSTLNLKSSVGSGAQATLILF